jgi:hypothetical protein
LRQELRNDGARLIATGIARLKTDETAPPMKEKFSRWLSLIKEK